MPPLHRLELTNPKKGQEKYVYTYTGLYGYGFKVLCLQPGWLISSNPDLAGKSASHYWTHSC